PVPLNITPASVRVKQSESVFVDIDGGTPPYTAHDSAGASGAAGTVEQVYGKYIWTLSAPVLASDKPYIYTLKDSNGQSVTLGVTVLAPLSIALKPP
ncbi:MAG: hypothetical protein HQK61_08705, partial [Desulfamplus sp.]|nr:hypothetical protein [Desulfamplus sp.]